MNKSETRAELIDPKLTQSDWGVDAKTKKLETIYQQKINSLEELKKSILQKAFERVL